MCYIVFGWNNHPNTFNVQSLAQLIPTKTLVICCMECQPRVLIKPQLQDCGVEYLVDCIMKHDKL